MPLPEGLGNLFDIVAGVVPVDLQTAQTGKRVLMKNAARCTIVLFKAAGTAGDDPTVDVQQANAATGGTVKDLDVVDHYYLKAEATLDGDEAWTRYTQTAASEIADPGGLTTSAEEQQILVIEIDAADMDVANQFNYLSLNVADVGGNAQLGGVLYILHGLRYPSASASLPATQ